MLENGMLAGFEPAEDRLAGYMLAECDRLSSLLRDLEAEREDLLPLLADAKYMSFPLKETIAAEYRNREETTAERLEEIRRLSLIHI